MGGGGGAFLLLVLSYQLKVEVLSLAFIVTLKQYGTNDVADTVSVHGVGWKRCYLLCYF